MHETAYAIIFICEHIVYGQHFNPRVFFFFSELNAMRWVSLDVCPFFTTNKKWAKLSVSEVNFQLTGYSTPKPAERRRKLNSCRRRKPNWPSSASADQIPIAIRIYIYKPCCRFPTHMNVYQISLASDSLHTRDNINLGLNNHNTFEISISVEARKKVGGI